MSLCCAFPPWSLDQWIKSLDGLHVAAPPFLAEAIELWDTKMARSTARLGNISKNMGLSCDGTDLNSWILISITFPFRSAWDASNFSSPWGLSLLTWERKAGFSPGARWRQKMVRKLGNICPDARRMRRPKWVCIRPMSRCGDVDLLPPVKSCERWQPPYCWDRLRYYTWSFPWNLRCWKLQFSHDSYCVISCYLGFITSIIIIFITGIRFIFFEILLLLVIIIATIHYHCYCCDDCDYYHYLFYFHRNDYLLLLLYY